MTSTSTCKVYREKIERNSQLIVKTRSHMNKRKTQIASVRLFFETKVKLGAELQGRCTWQVNEFKCSCSAKLTADFNFSCGLFSISGTRHETNSTQTYRAATNCISYKQKRQHVAASCRPLRPLQYRWCVVSLNRESQSEASPIYYESFSHAFGVC